MTMIGRLIAFSSSFRLQTVLLGELQVEDDQIDQMFAQDAGHVLDTRDGADPKAMLGR